MVENIGKGIARHVRISFNPDARLKAKVTLGELFGEIPFLAPGERRKTILFAATDKDDIDRMFPEGILQIDARWKDGSSYLIRKNSVTLKVRQYFGAGITGDTQEARALEEIRDAFLLVWNEVRRSK